MYQQYMYIHPMRKIRTNIEIYIYIFKPAYLSTNLPSLAITQPNFCVVGKHRHEGKTNVSQGRNTESLGPGISIRKQLAYFGSWPTPNDLSIATTGLGNEPIDFSIQQSMSPTLLAISESFYDSITFLKLRIIFNRNVTKASLRDLLSLDVSIIFDNDYLITQFVKLKFKCLSRDKITWVSR